MNKEQALFALALEPDATSEEIATAFRKRVKAVPSNINANQAARNAILNWLDEAQRVLLQNAESQLSSEPGNALMD